MTWSYWHRWPCKKAKREAESQRLIAMAKSEETLEMLEKEESNFAKKASQEDKTAKEFSRAKNEEAANKCLKRKRLHGRGTEVLGDLQYQILDQQTRLVLAKATIETLDSLRTGAAALEAMQKANNIADMYDVMDEINGRHKTMDQIEEVVSASHGAAAFFDKDEPEAKVQELEGTELGEQLPPAATASAGPEHVIDGPL